MADLPTSADVVSEGSEWRNLIDPKARRQQQNRFAQKRFRDRQLREQEHEAFGTLERRKPSESSGLPWASVDTHLALGRAAVASPEQSGARIRFEPSEEVELPTRNGQYPIASPSHAVNITSTWAQADWRSLKEVGERRQDYQMQLMLLERQRRKAALLRQPDVQLQVAHEEAKESHWTALRDVGERRRRKQEAVATTGGTAPRKVAVRPYGQQPAPIQTMKRDEQPTVHNSLNPGNEERHPAWEAFNLVEDQGTSSNILTYDNYFPSEQGKELSEPQQNSSHNSGDPRFRRQSMASPDSGESWLLGKRPGQLKLTAAFSKGMEIAHTSVSTASSIAPKFSYKPIASDQMRLLRIQPGELAAEMHCALESLNPFETNEWPEYECLSYCWQDGRNEDELVLITDLINPPTPQSVGTITVSATLLEALKRRRSLDSWTRIWIDAICINQKDETEKIQQIGLMQTIYRNASKVTIWLGEANETTKMLLHHASESIQARETPFQAFDGPPEGHIDSVLQAKSLLELCERPWFQRLWVVQELCLPKKAFVQYGDLQLPWDMLVAVVETASEAAMKLNLALKTIRLEANLSVLKSARTLWQGRDPSSPCTLLHQLGLLRGRACSIPADQIIGMLAICEDVSVGDLKLNYSMSCEEVYTAAAMHCINQGSLKVLSLCDNELSNVPDSGKDDKANSIPSWVPNWAQTVKPDNPTCFAIVIDRGKTRSHYNACGNTRLRRGNSPAPNLLALGGWIISRVVHVSPGNADLESLQELPFLTYRNQIQIRTASYLSKWYRAALAFHGGKLSEHQLQAFWRTTCAMSSGDKRARSIRPCFEVWLRMELEGMDSEQAFEELSEDEYGWYCDFIVHVDWVSRTRSFFITEDGSFGLASKKARVHDEVAIFSGGEVPFLLRRVLNGTFQLVGECYCNGIMDGEVLGRADYSSTVEDITLC